MIEEHLQYLKASGEYSQVTCEIARAWLLQFQAFCGGRDPAALKTKDLERWHKELVWTPGANGKIYSPGTVNLAVGAVRRFYRWAMATGKVSKNPTATLVTPAVKKPRKSRLDSLSPSKRRKLLACPNLDTSFGIRDRAILALLLETRISSPACSKIDLHHLCFDTGALLTKGRFQKIHSLSDGLLADLQRYCRESRPLLVGPGTQALFLDRFQNRLSVGSVQQVINRYWDLCSF
ncbi:MAG TPA: hypothetical protein EYO33_32720 [Phycisphaerales bacterium]|nr:hypothetical protein [Phycisphaerales bacterium]